MGNFRHSHIWIVFPVSVERWVMSPAQHQLHHSADSTLRKKLWHMAVDLGSHASFLLSSNSQIKPLWGPCCRAESSVSAPFGLVWPLELFLNRLWFFFAPFFRRLQMRKAILLKTMHRKPDEDGSIIVYSNDTRVLEAGAAYRIDEETLSTFEYDDVMRTLGAV